jgi:hypothetical protein
MSKANRYGMAVDSITLREAKRLNRILSHIKTVDVHIKTMDEFSFIFLSEIKEYKGVLLY